jgi:hypothetical protein
MKLRIVDPDWVSVDRYSTQFTSQTGQFCEPHRNDLSNPIEFDSALFRDQRSSIEDRDNRDVGALARSFVIEIARAFLG